MLLALLLEPSALLGSLYLAAFGLMLLAGAIFGALLRTGVNRP